MKPQNNQFLSDLLSKYGEFERVLMHASVSKKKNTKEEWTMTPEMVAYGVQQKALNILAEISGIVSARSEGKKHQGKKWEERMSRVISKFLKRYPETQDAYREELGLRGKMKIAKTVPTMNDLLDEIGVSVGEILSQSQSFIPDIYRTSANGVGEDAIITGSGNGLEEVRTASKYEILMQVLSSLWVDPRNVSVTTEKIDPKRMRKYPYKIVHIVWVPNPVTLTVSDEIGQSTYIYPGYVDLSQFIEAKKGSLLSGVLPEEVIYGEKYREGLERVIGGMLLGDVKKLNNKEINEKDLTEVWDHLSVQDNLTPEILRYQAMLLWAREELKEVWILERELDGKIVWCFDEASKWKSIKINGLGIISFPSSWFNKERHLWGKNGTIASSSDLAKMFEAIGLPVATDENYITLWREQLLSEKEELGKVGILEKEINGEMVWCFDETQTCDNWPKINKNSLLSFPSTVFNKEKKIGSRSGYISNPQELAKMFSALKIRIATEEEYILLWKEMDKIQIPRWREQLLSKKEELKKVGIIEQIIDEEIVWCFDKAYWYDKWPDINGKRLASFPKILFNKNRSIGDKHGTIQNSQELAKMFEALGLRVATQEEYLLLQKEKYEKQIPLWRKELLSEREALEKVRIVEKKIDDEMMWCFDKAKGCDKWPDIGEKSLRSFPNVTFNKEEKIGNKKGLIWSSQELAKMFEILWLRVKHPEKKNWLD